MADEDIWEMEFTRHKFPAAALPLGAVVTASGTGAEMNGGAVITNEALKLKTGMGAFAPRFAVLDPKYTLSVPRMQVISGAFDTLSHAMETYLGQSDQDNVSDDVALSIMRNTVVNIRRLLANIDDLQARGNLMWDSAMAENGILKVGRLTDFQTHQIEHQLGAYTDCNHGQGLAVIQPVYYRHILADAEEKFIRFAREVFGKETAAEGVEALDCVCGGVRAAHQAGSAEVPGGNYPRAAAAGGRQLQHHQVQPPDADPRRDLQDPLRVHVKTLKSALALELRRNGRRSEV